MVQVATRDIFQKLTEMAFNDDTVSKNLSGIDGFVNNNSNDATVLKEILDSMLECGKTNVESYIRFYNYSMKHSLFCLNHLFLKSSIVLLHDFQKTNKLDTNTTQITLLSKIIATILKYEICDYIDITDSFETIYFGKDVRFPVSFSDIKKYELEVLCLLRSKYTQYIIDSDQVLDTPELIRFIGKLNKIHNLLALKKYTSQLDDIVYSDKSKENLFKTDDISPNDYDKAVYDNYDILLFPMINDDIRLKNNKISFLNEGFGNIEYGTFSISSEDNIHFKQTFSLEHSDEFEDYLSNETKNKILSIDDSVNMQFVFDFSKFGNDYKFIFSKKAGKVKEMMNNNEQNNGINVTFNGNPSFENSPLMIGNNQKMKFNIVPLKDMYENLANELDKTSMNDNEKSSLQDDINDTIKELKSENINVSKVKEYTNKIKTTITGLSGCAHLLTHVEKIQSFLSSIGGN
ncbi:hypothetical protein [Methanolobus vulcani]|nr:hypothetical protein [Methanolobus vulcani]